jgi:hypothetical protein
VAAATKSKPRVVEYWDAQAGRWMVRRPGRRGVERHSPEGEAMLGEARGGSSSFDARRSLRRAGATVDRGASRLATGARQGVPRAVRRAGASPEPIVGFGPTGVGGLLVTVGASVLGLALLENLLGGRGPAAFDHLLGLAGQGIRKLVDPNDPIIRQGQPPPAPVSLVGPVAKAQPDQHPTVRKGYGAQTGGRITYPAMTTGGADPFPHLQFASGADWQHVDLGLLKRLDTVGAQLGQVITVFSGYRSPSYSANVGGYSTDPHTRGVAVDANVGSTPLGNYPGAASALAAVGLESGAQPNFYRGQPDPTHVQVPGSGINKAIHALVTWATRGNG